MAQLLSLKTAEQRRNTLTQEQKVYIQKLFEDLAKKAGQKAEFFSGRNNISSALQQQQLRKLAQELIDLSNKLLKSLGNRIEADMLDTSEALIEAQKEFLKNIGIVEISGLFAHVPAEIVTAIATGEIYEGNWSLSQAIWGISKKTATDINKIVAEGVALNKSTYEIAKDLEKYVSPLARKEWDWSKVYPGTNKKVDYSAQRLARTLVSHAYQQALIRSCSKNPFVTGFKWRSAHTYRTCEICNARDGQIYAKNELPLDHPNGLCTFTAVIPDDYDTITTRLALWVRGGKDPDLDNWFLDMLGSDGNSANLRTQIQSRMNP